MTSRFRVTHARRPALLGTRGCAAVGTLEEQEEEEESVAPPPCAVGVLLRRGRVIKRLHTPTPPFTPHDLPLYVGLQRKTPNVASAVTQPVLTRPTTPRPAPGSALDAH